MEHIIIPIVLLQQMVSDSIAIGYDKAMEEHSESVKIEVTKRWAYKKYGRKLVDQWIESGIVTPLVKNGFDKLNRHELYKAHKTYNWHLHKIKQPI